MSNPSKKTLDGDAGSSSFLAIWMAIEFTGIPTKYKKVQRSALKLINHSEARDIHKIDLLRELEKAMLLTLCSPPLCPEN